MSASLDDGVVATVADRPILASTVARIAAAQGISPEEALDRAIFDALLAEEARSTDRADLPEVRTLVSAQLAKRMTRAFREEAEAMGPATDEEVAALTERRWVRLNRPRSVEVVHAVVVVPENATEDQRLQAEEVARKVAQATRDAAERARGEPQEIRKELAMNADPAADDFVAAAKTVPSTFKIVAQRLPPFTAEGISLEGAGAFFLEFVDGAMALERRGDVSPPTWSPAGVHVIMRLRDIPAFHPDLEERRRIVEPWVIEQRTKELRASMLEAARTDVELVPGHELLLFDVRVPTDETPPPDGS